MQRPCTPVIHITSPAPNHAGELLTGIVSLPYRGDDNFSPNVVISVQGRVKTRIPAENQTTNSKPHQGRVPLICLRENIGQSQRSRFVKDGLWKQHFTIRIPKSVGNMQNLLTETFEDGQGGLGYWHQLYASKGFDVSPDQVMPPSLDPRETGFSPENMASIAYVITATVNVDSTAYKASKLIKIYPPLAPSIPDEVRTRTHPCSLGIMHVLSEHSTSTFHLANNLKDFLRTDDALQLEFNATMKQPKYASLSHSLTLRVALAPDKARSSLLVAPPIKLLRMRARIVSTTCIRCPGSLHDNTKSQSVSVWWQDEDLRRKAPEFDKGNNWTLAVRTRKLEGFAPSFATHNVAVKHVLKVTWVIGCAGRVVEFKDESDIHVFSGVRSGKPATPGAVWYKKELPPTPS